VAKDLPKILLDYSKEVIRKSPVDIIKFSRQFFEQKCKDNNCFEELI
jgi:serine/threonine protein kinase